MTKLTAGKSAAARYREMAEAAARCAREATNTRDKAVYQALAQGWKSLAEAESARAHERPRSAPKTKRKVKPGNSA
jgi:hypothetical protein